MQLPNILLANECGIGRGHIANLVHMVKHMGKDFNYFAGLHRLQHIEELQSLGVTAFKSKGMFFTDEAMQDHALEGNATWADYLFSIGLARPDLVRQNLVYWMNQITLKNISILVAEYAPIAILAARVLKAEGWDISVICVGTSYSVPPAHLESFPVILPDISHSTRKEADVLEMLNGILADFKAPPLPHIAAIYDVDLALPMSFPFLDPYRKWRGPQDLLQPEVKTYADVQTSGDEVFVYFSTSELDEPQVVQALCDLPLPRRAYLPYATDEVKARLSTAGVQIEMAALTPQVLAEKTALFLHGGQAGTINMAAMIGRPQIGLPQHLEQTFHARRAGQQGILELLERSDRTAQNIVNLVLRSYNSTSMQARARAFAAELAAAAQDAGPSLTQRLEPILAHAKAQVFGQPPRP